MKTKTTLLVVVAIMILTGFQQKVTSSDTSEIKKGMTKVTIMYPNEERKTFDMDYYASKHMPLLSSLFGEDLKAIHIDKGISGRTSDDPALYVAIGYLYFDTLEDYQNGIGSHIDKIRSDIPNYTDIQPEILISEVIQ